MREEDDCVCLDDWEAMADALAATDNKQQQHQNTVEYGSQLDATNPPFSGSGISNANPESGGATAKQSALLNCCTWKPDDADHPQSLPNLSKQFGFPLNSQRRFCIGGSVWGCSKNLGPIIPTSCPICFQDLDCTDSIFLPCSCGFRLCLFCHKRILEKDGRCLG